MYPAVAGDIPFLHGGLPQNQTHRFRSDSFYWSDDSRQIVFADSVQDAVSIVLVTIEGDQVGSFVHRLTASEVCGQGSEGDIRGGDVMLSNARPTAASIELEFRSHDNETCRPKALILTRSDFTPAAIEVHEPPHRRDHSTMKQP